MIIIINESEFREQYQIEVTNRFAALETVKDEEDVNRTWKNIKENILTSVKKVRVCTNRSRINLGLKRMFRFIWIKGSQLK